MLTRTNNLEGVTELAQKVISYGEGCLIWMFKGDLGAGKTTLIKELCSQLGVLETVKSPTFNIVHEYKTTHGTSIFHFDFYRLKSVEEALDIGIEDYFFSNSLCLIEWPEIIEDFIDQDYLTISISHNDADGRQYDISKNE